MKQTQTVALILVALLLGIVIGMKIEKNRPVVAAGSAPTGAVCSTAPAVAAPEPVKDAAKPVLPRLVDLGSTTCIPCKKLAPILEELKKEYKGKVSVEFIDITKDAAAADQYKITVIPTQIFIDKDGKEVFRHEGFYPKADILAQFAKMGIPAN